LSIFCRIKLYFHGYLNRVQTKRGDKILKKNSKKILLAFSLSLTLILLSTQTTQVYNYESNILSILQKSGVTNPLSSFVQNKNIKISSKSFKQESQTIWKNISHSFSNENSAKQASAEAIRVVPGGNLLGLKMNTEGILVVGLSHVINKNSQKLTPLENAGIDVGDQIITLNGENITSTKKLVNLVEKSRGGDMAVVYKHDGQVRTTSVKPVLGADGNYRLGVWVRDSSAGIGTMTFYNPQNHTFGALGHAICDVDTGEAIKITDGKVLSCDIFSLVKSKKGSPGEIQGSLSQNSPMGDIKANDLTGIFGTLSFIKIDESKTIEVGSRFSVKEGDAKILCSLDGKTIKEYSIKIEKKSIDVNNSKGMIIRITDPKLLEETGGIVQGMSGSPIIQNNHLIGAVTHVFVNDPTRGYGIFIENMLDDCSKIAS
jgi:stage IV sporulation protein B